MLFTLHPESTLIPVETVIPWGILNIIYGERYVREKHYDVAIFQPYVQLH